MSFAKKSKRALVIPVALTVTVVAGGIATLGACGSNVVATGGGTTTSNASGTGGTDGGGGSVTTNVGNGGFIA
jgi:hypothetical protein